MADQQRDQDQPEELFEQPPAPMKSIWPAPPPFYKHFTKQNTNELRRLRKEAADLQPSSSTGEQTIDILSLPPELRYLIPPPPPGEEPYNTFGRQSSLNAPDPTLADQGIEQLYPDHPSVKLNPQPHLTALARSLLTKYLHLLGLLSKSPERFEDATKDLDVIVRNMHSLVNEYRPHQARESLILMLEGRVETLRGECRGIEEAGERARNLLAGFEGDGEGLGRDGEAGGEKGGKDEGEMEAKEARQRNAWEALGREMVEG